MTLPLELILYELRSGPKRRTVVCSRLPTTRLKHTNCSAPRRRKPTSLGSAGWKRSGKARSLTGVRPRQASCVETEYDWLANSAVPVLIRIKDEPRGIKPKRDWRQETTS